MRAPKPNAPNKPGGAMKNRRRLLAVALAVAAGALSGCLESGDTICYRPGVYQGAADPLIGNSDPDALAARFRGQTDR